MAGNSFGPGGSFWTSGSGKGVVGGSSSGGGGGGGSTARTNAAAAARLNAQGKAYKSAGLLSKDGKSFYGRPDPMAALEAFLNGSDMYGSGGGGGGGGGGGYGGNGAQIAAMKAMAEQRNAGQKGQLDDLYGDYARLIEKNPEQTKQTYQTLRDQSASAGAGIAQQANERQDQNDATRNSGLATLGVSADAINASPSAERVATQENMGTLAQQNSSWGNLQGVLGAAQEQRDKLDIAGVQDAKVLAHRQLAQNYEKFMQDLDAQLVSGGGGGGGGSSSGGGGGGGPTNKYRDKLQDSIFDQLLINAGYKNAPSSGSQSSGSSFKPNSSQMNALTGYLKGASSPSAVGAFSALGPSGAATYNYIKGYKG